MYPVSNLDISLFTICNVINHFGVQNLYTISLVCSCKCVAEQYIANYIRSKAYTLAANMCLCKGAVCCLQ